MKINTHCHQCLKEDNLQSLDIIIRENGLYEFTCVENHKSLICLTNPKFEILFDIGIRALLDGYTRESVASIAASLERFYEFYIRVIQTKHAISDEEIKFSWKLVSNQSERQIGAFVYTYLIENNKSVNLIESKKMKPAPYDSVAHFRNAVIHKGTIPTKEEVIIYGEIVLSFIKDTLNELKLSNDELIKKLIKADTESNLKNCKEETQPCTMQITTTFISNAPLEYGLAPTTFEEALELSKKLNVIQREF